MITQVNNLEQDLRLKTSFKPSLKANLKAFQSEVMESRAVVLAEIDSLVDAGFGRSKAIDHFIKLAQRKQLTDFMMHKLFIANARSGFKSKAENMKRTISRSTLYLWLKERTEKGVTALAPKPIIRAPFVPAWAPAVMKLYGQPQKPSLAYVMEILPDDLDQKIPVPSYNQVRRFLKKLSAQARNHGRVGKQKLKSMKAYIQRDISDLWPGAVYAADGHRFDAEVAHPRHGRPFRPEITTVIDVYTRKVVGWSVALEEDTWGVLDAARHAFENNGLCDIWYVDNGRGFNNKNWDNELTGFMARFGVTKKNSLPYNSQARGVIERLHQSLWVRGAKSLTSFIGKDMDEEARQRNFKLTRQDIKTYGNTANIISWNDFMDWAEVQVMAYNNRPHSFLPKVRDKDTYKRRHQTPEEVWTSCTQLQDQSPTLSKEQRDDIYRPYTKRRTNRAMVNLYGNRYFALELEAYHGEDVLVGYDIHDASKVWIRDLDQRLICKAEFEGNKQSFFPVEVVRKAHKKRLNNQINRLDQKRALLTQEQDTVSFEGNLIELEASSTSIEQHSQSTRPSFRDDGEWITWLINHPDKIEYQDQQQLRSLIHKGNFKLLLETLNIDFANVKDLL